MASQSFLSAPSKATKSVEFEKAFLRFIGNNYDDTPSRYAEAVKEFSTLRESTVVKSPDKHETGLDLITRYYDQLCAMENKLPISESQIRIKFSWTEAFCKGGLFGGGKSVSETSSMYEQCSVLFNVGALQSQIAKVQNFSSDDGLKSAAKYFQASAGTFQLLQEQVFAHLQTASTPDLSAESTTALMGLMLAQAQESFCIKAAKDKIKDQVIAKIAMQATDLYADALTNMQAVSVRNMWDKGWLPMVAAKQAYFHAVAQHHMGLVAQAKKNFGEAVARLQKATELLKEAEKRGEGSFKPYDLTSCMIRDYEQAVKDNNFIYNDLVPSFATLEPPGKATLAKPVQFTSPASNFLDLFKDLLPLSVSQAASVYTTKRLTLVAAEMDRLRDATHTLNELLTDKNLPAAIEDTGGNELPESIRQKATEVSSLGGLGNLEKKFQELPELLQRNKEVLSETTRMLDEEEHEDTELKVRFKEKWRRAVSSQLTGTLRNEINKFKGILDNATRADSIVKEKYQSNCDAMLLLSKTEADITASLPAAGTLGAVASGTQSVLDLRALMEEVRTLKAEREVIEQTLRDPVDDIIPKFLQALKDLGDVDEEALSEAHLRSEYSSTQKQVTTSMESQEDVVQRIITVHDQFIRETQSHGVSAREQKLKELAAGHDAYIELDSNLTEGIKFYNDLTPLLLKIQSKVSDFVFARKTEKEDLLKEVQKSAAGLPAASSGPVPQYQQQPAQQSQPPGRLPPPQQRQPPAQPLVQQAAQPLMQQAAQAPSQPGVYQRPPPAQPYPQQQPGYYQPPPGAPGSVPPQGYPPQPVPYGYPVPYYHPQQPGQYPAQPPPQAHPQGYYIPQQPGYQPPAAYQPPPRR